MRFTVSLIATAHVRGTIEVDAATREEARAAAGNLLGDVDWTYDGLVEGREPDVAGVDPAIHRPLADGHARCDNCQLDTRLEDLRPIRRAHERLDQWGVSPVPAGECPACGALAYGTR